MTQVKFADPDQDVLRAALVILNRDGYAALSMTEVAKQLKVSKQRIYYHYTSSEDIILRLAKRWSESGQALTLQALAETRETGAMRTLAIAEGMFQWMMADSELARLGLILYQQAPRIKKLGQFMDHARGTGRTRMRTLLEADPRYSKLSEKAMDAKVTILHSQIYGFFFYAIAMNEWKNLEEVCENCLSGLRALLERKD